MSLNVLLKCSDQEFEKLIGGMDLESIIDVVAEIQLEMDREQHRFDKLTNQLALIKDQASAEFRQVSNELIKSQNRLALLMTRNMHCFTLQNENPIQKQANYVQVSNNSNNNLPAPTAVYQDKSAAQGQGHLSKHSQETEDPESQRASVAPKKHKVIKVTRVVTRKVMHGAPPTIEAHLANNSSRSITSSNTPTDPLVTTATVKVLPRPSVQEIQSKRTLHVKGSNTGSSSTDILSTPSTVKQDVISAAVDSFTSKSEYAQRLHDSRSPLPTSKVLTEASSTLLNRMPYSKPIPAQTVLELDIPSSNIDDVDLASPFRDAGETTASGVVNASEVSPQRDVSTSEIVRDSAAGDIGSDKHSYTTDESGFTSASSDTDVTVAPHDIMYDYHSEEESDLVAERVFMKSWDPIKLLQELYALRLAKEPTVNGADIINMEGYLEQLPVGKKKNTLLKTWKRSYCRAKDGIMYFYDTKSTESPKSFLSLMGGVLEELSNRMIGVDDMRGHYLMVRCPTDLDYMNWKRSLYTQISCSPHTTYIRPMLTSAAHTSKVIVIDLGSSSVRAGILGQTPTYPQIFFPCVSSTSVSGKKVFGFEAYKPENRANGLHFPVGRSRKVDSYRINVQVVTDLFLKIFDELNVQPEEYMIMLATPHNFSLKLKEELLNTLIGWYKVRAVNMVNQPLLTPYIYNATSGIVVDIGERIEIVAVTDGYLVEHGLNRQAFGGGRVSDTLNSYLAQYRLLTTVENLIVRLIKEKACYISQNYGDDLLEFMSDSSGCEATIDLSRFDLPDGAHMRQITLDTARFKAPEGLLKMELFGVDSPTLPKLIQLAVQKCPMDVRREMWQSIYLSGGTTLTQGFAERLQKELVRIAPTSVTVQVHASPHRYHAAYIGACTLAKLPNFQDSCITREEWMTAGVSALSKWKSYFQG